MFPHFFVSKWRAMLIRCRTSDLATPIYAVVTGYRRQRRRGCHGTISPNKYSDQLEGNAPSFPQRLMWHGNDGAFPSRESLRSVALQTNSRFFKAIDLTRFTAELCFLNFSVARSLSERPESQKQNGSLAKAARYEI